jgi:signal transduction histidine kinase
MSADDPSRDQSPELNEAQLRSRVAELEAKLDEFANLVAQARHDINNPLTGVLGQAQLLLRADLSEKVRERVQKIEELALRTIEVAAKLRQVPAVGASFNCAPNLNTEGAPTE